MDNNDKSNLSKGAAIKDGPVKQHHRLARGDKISGQDNPNAGAADTKTTIANAKCNY